ncbi:hypothetical protein [Rhizobacter sp. LjRoot28]|uniref:hypothetical protein n=1 Tax=Rhizobacter sp. LjRoot28 TaxID=3342309 RepID=UPI003ECFC908
MTHDNLSIRSARPATPADPASPAAPRASTQAPSRSNSLAHRTDGAAPTRTSSGDLSIRPRQSVALVPLDRTGAAVATDAAAPVVDVGLARTLPEFQRRLDAQRNRPVNLDEAAAVINAVRHNPLAGGEAPKAHKDLAARATPDMITRWNRALGLSAEQEAAMTRVAAQGGRWIPTSGSAFQAALYGAIPFAALKASPVHVLYASLAALVAQPFVTAGLQTPIVSAITLMRQKGAPMVKMPGNLKAKETLPEIERQIKTLEADAAQDARQMNALMQRLAARHARHDTGTEAGEEAIGAFLAALSPDERSELEALQQRQTDRAVEVGLLVMDAFRLEGMQDRQFNSTLAQAPWRVARSMSGIYAPALQAAGAPAAAVTATSVVLAFAAIAGQHHAAGLDEQTAQADEHKLGLLYGDLFTPQGQADWNAGRPVTAAGIDEAKFRNLIAEPETTIAGRVAAHLAVHRDDLQARLDALGPHAATDDDAEQGRPEVETLRASIAECEHDIGLLQAGNVTDLSAGGHARQLLADVMKDTSVAFAWREGVAKLRSPLEYSAQLGQRFAAQFAFIGAGGAGAVGLVRGVGAAVGGTSTMAAGAQVALSVGAGVLGAFSALTQYTAVNVKNARRDRQGDDAGLLAQVARGIVSPLWQRHATQAGHAATQAGHAALQHDRRVLTDVPDGPLAEASNPAPTGSPPRG